MKYFILPAIFVFAVSNLLRYIAPWWSVFPVGLLAGWLWPNTGRTSMAAFTGAFFLWTFHAFLADQQNLSLLSTKVGLLFKGLGSLQLVLITGLLGGLLAACGAWLGAAVRGLMRSY